MVIMEMAMAMEMAVAMVMAMALAMVMVISDGYDAHTYSWLYERSLIRCIFWFDS